MKEFLEKLVESDGSIEVAAAEMQLPRRTLYHFIKNYPEFNIAIKDMQKAIEKNFMRNEIVPKFIQLVRMNNWRALERAMNSLGLYMPDGAMAEKEEGEIKETKIKVTFGD